MINHPETRKAALTAAGVFSAALLIRLVYLYFMRQSPYFDVTLLMGTDCYAYYEWASRIAGGDLVGEGRFYQAPLYPYFLALILKLFGGAHFVAVRIVQFIMGSLTAALVYLMARKLKGDLAGILAGLMVAFYGPLIFYESAFLRTGLLAFLNTALVLLLFMRPGRRALWLAAAIGMTFALGLLAKPNLAVMAPILIWWVWVTPKRTSAGEVDKEDSGRSGIGKARVMLAALMAAGFFLMMSPLAVRNHYAGAPRFSISQRGAFEFIAGNLPESPSAGWRPTERSVELKDQSNRRLVPAVITVLKLYRDNPLAFLGKQLAKTRAFVYGYEVPNNVNYYVEKKQIQLFRLPLVTWPIALSLGLLGIWFSRREWRSALPLLGYLLFYSAGVIAFYILARFRLPVVPTLCVFGGIGLAGIIELVRKKRWLAALTAIVLLSGVAFSSWPRERDPLRPQDYYNLARIYAQKGDRRQAWLWVERGRENVERAAKSGEDGYSHYYRAYFMFLAGEPLDRVQAELLPARRLAADENLELMVEMLSEECRDRLKQGDHRKLGLRFMTL